MTAMRVAVGSFACAVFLGVAGCSQAAFTKLPSRQEVSTKATEALLAEYQDFQTYRPSVARLLGFPDGIYGMPSADPMIAAWGPPASKRLSWMNLLPACMVPPFHPTWIYTWDFGNKEVTAMVDCPMAFGYRPHVWDMRLRNRTK